MNPNGLDAMRGAEWILDDQRYLVAHLNPNAITAAAAIIAEQDHPFQALIVDRDEVTLVAAAELLEFAARRFSGLDIGSVVYRLITLDVVFSLEVIGVLAAIAPCLAEAEIPVLALSSFSRDHFLVPEGRAQEAIERLRALTGSEPR